MKKIKKLCAGFFCAMILVFSVAVPANAETVSSDGLFSDLWESLPQEVTEYFGKEALEDEESLEKGVENLTSPSEMAGIVVDFLFAALGDAVKLFCVLLGLLLIAAAASALAEGIANSALSSAVRFCCAGGIISAIIFVQYSHFEQISEFFEKLRIMMGTMLPMTAAIWAMGGNVGTASVGGATFEVILHVCGALWSSSVIPVCCVLSALSFCDVLCEEMRTGRIMRAIKKIYNFVLGLTMTVLLFSLSVQTAIAASADTIAARTARLVGASVIPGIGGGVSETFRTVGAGVVHLKNIFGVSGIVMLALLVLPVLLSLMLSRFAFMLAAGVGEMLGCDNESRLLENLCEVYGCMLSVVAASSAVFIIALCIFMQGVVAVM